MPSEINCTTAISAESKKNCPKLPYNMPSLSITRGLTGDLKLARGAMKDSTPPLAFRPSGRIRNTKESVATRNPNESLLSPTTLIQATLIRASNGNV